MHLQHNAKKSQALSALWVRFVNVSQSKWSAIIIANFQQALEVRRLSLGLLLWVGQALGFSKCDSLDLGDDAVMNYFPRINSGVY